MYLEVLKHEERHGWCFWKLITRKKDMAHSFTGSRFKNKKQLAVEKLRDFKATDKLTLILKDPKLHTQGF